MSDLIDRLRSAAENFEAIRAEEANNIDSDCEPHWSNQVEMADASKAALEAADEIKRLRHDLASAEGRAKNATSDLQYWRGQYEEIANASPSSILEGSRSIGEWIGHEVAKRRSGNSPIRLNQDITYGSFSDGTPVYVGIPLAEPIPATAKVHDIRAQAIEDVLSALTGHELYLYRPKAFHGFIQYARETLIHMEEDVVVTDAHVKAAADAYWGVDVHHGEAALDQMRLALEAAAGVKL